MRTALRRWFKRKHVTLSILWDEYVERNPEGYRYSRLRSDWRCAASGIPIGRSKHLKASP
jgi:transposase